MGVVRAGDIRTRKRVLVGHKRDNRSGDNRRPGVPRPDADDEGIIPVLAQAVREVERAVERGS